MADVFGADDFKVRRAFFNNFYHPWDLQEEHMMVILCMREKAEEKHKLQSLAQ